MVEQPTTPFILIDLSTLEQNIRRMADYARGHGLALRPHTKTHKSVQIGRMQVQAGAVGLTVAKPGEAEVMANACADLLMAYPAIDPRRCAMLASLAKSKVIRVGLDSFAAADVLSEAASAAGSTIGALVDLDVGHHRTGVQDSTAALGLARHIDRSRGLRLDGLMFFPGHVSTAAANAGEAMSAVEQLLSEVIDRWRVDGLEAKIVSGGSTPAAHRSHFIKSQTEIRPGTYVYNDMNSVHGGSATLEDCAARIMTTVISTAVPGQIVLDAGSKTLTSDRCGPAPDSGHGYLPEYPRAKITKLSEEHAQVDIRECDKVPKIGERVAVIPNHICPCVNLQDRIWLHREGEAPTPLPVNARGKVW